MRFRAHALLIVPYGIETESFHSVGEWDNPFNRTLWNWNVFQANEDFRQTALLIVPYGIETM